MFEEATKVKMFRGYAGMEIGSGKLNFEEVEQKINEFISNKNLIDIKVSGSQDSYGSEMFHYVVIYKEKEEE